MQHYTYIIHVYNINSTIDTKSCGSTNCIVKVDMDYSVWLLSV